MANAIINLVNKAMSKIGELPMEITEYDSGLESHQARARGAVEEILSDMFDLQKDEKLRLEFTLTTTASTALYSLGFDGSLLADTNLRVIKSDKTDYWLNYLDQDTALEKYIDFNNLTDEAAPWEWWFVTGSSADDIKLRLNPVPDAVYTIKGFKYTPNSAVTALSVTPFTDRGDALIVDYVASQVGNLQQVANIEDITRQEAKSWAKYLLENQKTNNVTSLALPYQTENDIAQY